MRYSYKVLTIMLVALAASACSGGPTGPAEEVPPGELRLALVRGDSQEVQVTDTLPTDVVVEVTKGGEPLTNQLVDWTVLSDDCGSPFVTTTRTDSEGRTGNRLVAGTRAWTRPDGEDVCRMEVRYALVVADTVQARVDTTVNYLVEPGAAETNTVESTRFTGTDLRVLPADAVEDQYGNPVVYRLEPTCCAHRQGDEPGTPEYRTLVVDSAGTGEVRMMVADTIVDTATLETGGSGSIQIAFYN